MSRRVAVLMSGGVDSSVAALLLLESGCSVTGVTIKHLSGPQTNAVDQARSIAESLGIPHRILDLSEEFDISIVKPFIARYGEGITPNPCVRCNRMIKFGLAFSKVRRMGIDHLATGHYARLLPTEGGVGLFRATDLSKDQSYFLYAVPPGTLERVMFPVGEMTKEEVRGRASEAGLSIPRASESRDICFAVGSDYRHLINREEKPGRFVHIDGRALGFHKGVSHYTIGQRKGLNLGGGGEVFYVTGIDPGSSTVYVGPRRALEETFLTAEDAAFLAPVEVDMPVEVKVRSQMEPQPARIESLGPDSIGIRFKGPQTAVTPGQSAVLYVAGRVVAGGVIARKPVPSSC